MQDTQVYAQYHTFLIKCTDCNKMQKIALKIDKIRIFLGQLPKYIVILSLIDFHANFISKSNIYILHD